MEARIKEKDENGCVAGHLCNGIHPDSTHYVEKRFKYKVSDEDNIVLGSQHNRIIRDRMAGI